MTGGRIRKILAAGRSAFGEFGGTKGVGRLGREYFPTLKVGKYSRPAL